MQQLVIPTSFNIDLGFELAPIHKRILAFLVDIFIQFIYIISLTYAFSLAKISLFDDDNGISIFLIFLLISPVLFYHLLSETLMDGESIGKRIFGIKVISLDGNTPSLSQYLLRWFLRTVDFGTTSCLGGIICSAVTKNGQRIGDLAAGTTVVSKKLPYKIDNTIFKNINETNYQVTYPQVMRLSDRDINTINNILQQHRKSDMQNYMVTISDKIKTVLNITTQENPADFLDTLLNDYNYLSQKR